MIVMMIVMIILMLNITKTQHDINLRLLQIEAHNEKMYNMQTGHFGFIARTKGYYYAGLLKEEMEKFPNLKKSN